MTEETKTATDSDVRSRISWAVLPYVGSMPVDKYEAMLDAIMRAIASAQPLIQEGDS